MPATTSRQVNNERVRLVSEACIVSSSFDYWISFVIGAAETKHVEAFYNAAKAHPSWVNHRAEYDS